MDLFNVRQANFLRVILEQDYDRISMTRQEVKCLIPRMSVQKKLNIAIVHSLDD